MFPTWKLIFQKTRLKIFTLILFAVLFVILLVGFIGDSCRVDDILIRNEILSYEKSSIRNNVKIFLNKFILIMTCVHLK